MTAKVEEHLQHAPTAELKHQDTPKGEREKTMQEEHAKKILEMSTDAAEKEIVANLAAIKSNPQLCKDIALKFPQLAGLLK